MAELENMVELLEELVEQSRDPQFSLRFQAWRPPETM